MARPVDASPEILELLPASVLNAAVDHAERPGATCGLTGEPLTAVEPIAILAIVDPADAETVQAFVAKRSASASRVIERPGLRSSVLTDLEVAAKQGGPIRFTPYLSHDGKIANVALELPGRRLFTQAGEGTVEDAVVMYLLEQPGWTRSPVAPQQPTPGAHVRRSGDELHVALSEDWNDIVLDATGVEAVWFDAARDFELVVLAYGVAEASELGEALELGGCALALAPFDG